MSNHTSEINLIDSFERIPVKIVDNLGEGSKMAAAQIAALIRQKEAANQPCVLGLATGSTPKTLYAENWYGFTAKKV